MLLQETTYYNIKHSKSHVKSLCTAQVGVTEEDYDCE